MLIDCVNFKVKFLCHGNLYAYNNVLNIQSILLITMLKLH